ncbi:hypothetical protein ACEQPO_29870 [Bacillus sp. SL00103]
MVSENTSYNGNISDDERRNNEKNHFFDWTIHLQADLTAITDHHEKKMVI